MATSSGADWLDKLIARHSAELDDLEEAEVEQFLAAYEDGRRELKERLDGLEGADRGETWTAFSHRAAMLQVEVGIKQMQDRLGRTLGAQEERRHAMAVDHLKEVLRRAEPEFGTSWPNIATAATRRMQAERELLLYKHSIDRYGADLTDKIKRELVRARITQAPIRETAKRIAGADRSVFDGLKGRAELIARMENNRAYGAGHQASLEVSADVIDGPVDPSTGERPRAHGDPLMKKATEFRDRRNHPMSLALDGRVAPVAGEWEVPLEEVVEAGSRIKKPIGGIVWPLDGGTYKGAAYPAHFNDRGRQVPWRASWAGMKERVKARGDELRAEGEAWRKEAKRKADEAKTKAKRAAAAAGRRRPPGKVKSLAAAATTEGMPTHPSIFQGHDDLDGEADFEHEVSHAQRFRQFRGGGKFRFAGNSTSGFDGWWRGPEDGAPEEMVSLASVKANDIIKAGLRQLRAKRRPPGAATLFVTTGFKGDSVRAALAKALKEHPERLPSFDSYPLQVWDTGEFWVILSREGVQRRRVR